MMLENILKKEKGLLEKIDQYFLWKSKDKISLQNISSQLASPKNNDENVDKQFKLSIIQLDQSRYQFQSQTLLSVILAIFGIIFILITQPQLTVNNIIYVSYLLYVNIFLVVIYFFSSLYSILNVRKRKNVLIDMNNDNNTD